MISKVVSCTCILQNCIWFSLESLRALVKIIDTITIDLEGSFLLPTSTCWLWNISFTATQCFFFQGKEPFEVTEEVHLETFLEYLEYYWNNKVTNENEKETIQWNEEAKEFLANMIPPQTGKNVILDIVVNLGIFEMVWILNLLGITTEY